MSILTEPLSYIFIWEINNGNYKEENMNKKYIYAHAETKESGKENKDLTAKHWKVYYYLLSLSKYNPSAIENHRYIYKSAINITTFCKELEIKSRQTFYTAISKLKSCSLIKETEEYYLIYSKNWVKINIDLLLNLIRCSKIRDEDIDLLRLYLVLKKLSEIVDKNKRAFTLRDMVIILGHHDSNEEYYRNIRLYLALLSFWDLIEIKTHTEVNNAGKSFLVYHLEDIHNSTDSKDFVADIKEQMSHSIMSEDLIEKLRFNYFLHES